MDDTAWIHHHCFQCLNSFLFPLVSFFFAWTKNFSIVYCVNRTAIKFFKLPKFGWQSKNQEFETKKTQTKTSSIAYVSENNSIYLCIICFSMVFGPISYILFHHCPYTFDLIWNFLRIFPWIHTTANTKKKLLSSILSVFRNGFSSDTEWHAPCNFYKLFITKMFSGKCVYLSLDVIRYTHDEAPNIKKAWIPWLSCKHITICLAWFSLVFRIPNFKS